MPRQAAKRIDKQKKKEELLTAIVQFETLKNCTSKRLAKYMEELNSELIKIEKFITPNAIVFRTNNAKKAGKTIEKWLLHHFKLTMVKQRKRR